MKASGKVRWPGQICSFPGLWWRQGCVHCTSWTVGDPLPSWPTDSVLWTAPMGWKPAQPAASPFCTAATTRAEAEQVGRPGSVKNRKGTSGGQLASTPAVVALLWPWACWDPLQDEHSVLRTGGCRNGCVSSPLWAWYLTRATMFSCPCQVEFASAAGSWCRHGSSWLRDSSPQGAVRSLVIMGPVIVLGWDRDRAGLMLGQERCRLKCALVTKYFPYSWLFCSFFK